MKTTIIGPGAIGGLAAAYLAQNGAEVSLVARAETVKVIRDKGLRVSGVRGKFSIKLDISERMQKPAELVIIATKSQDVEAAVMDNLQFMREGLVLTAQNGVRADDLIRKIIPAANLISSIVMFASTSLSPGELVHNFEGAWIIGRPEGGNDLPVMKLVEFLGKSFNAIASEEITGMKYLKVFVNANNCIPALLGRSVQESFSDERISSIAMSIWREGLGVIRQNGINLVSLPDFQLDKMLALASMPLSSSAKIYGGIMGGISKTPVYGSIFQSIKRGRTSEIDFINGEFVRLAEKKGTTAPLNARMVELVHDLEKSNKFLTSEELLEQTKGLCK